MTRFTGKERDAETGLDYFGARYVSAAQGRFTSPDWSETPQAVPYASLEDPQTLNLYSYVSNNPLARNDLDGHVDSMTINNRRANGYDGPIRATPNEERFVGGAFKLALGVGLTGTAAVGNPSSLTGALLVANSIMSGASMTVSGVTDLMGAATGNDTSKGTDALSATSNLPGLATTAATGGNIATGKVVANATSMATLGVKLTNNPVNVLENPATSTKAAKDTFTFIDNLKSGLSQVSNYFKATPSPPPPPQAPQPPLCSTSSDGCR